MRNLLARVRDVVGGRGRSFETLRADLNRDDVGARRRAASAMGGLGDPRAVEPLIAALDGPACGAAAAALGRLGDPRAVEPLIVAFQDERREWHRSLVGQALGVLGDARAVDPLVAALGDRRWATRRSAVEALDALGWRPADDEQRCRRAIAAGDWDQVAALGSAAVEPLLAHLRTGEDVPEVATALGRIGDRRAVTPLLGRLKHPYGSGKPEILGALATLDPPGAAARWVAALSPESRTDGAQEAAIHALRELRPSWDEELVGSLIALLERGRPGEAGAAARVLEGTRSPEVSSALAAYRARLGAQRDRLRGMPPHDLLAELVAIGRGVGYLGQGPDFELGRNVRARAMGGELDRRGGRDLMRAAHDRVAADAGRLRARELESSWDGVGDWRG